MPIDPSSIFGNIKTYADYQKAEEDFALRKAAAQQQLTTGAIDAETKKNTYASQLLSAATANGDQYTYDAAKQHLQNLGVDTSMFAPDVQSGAQQAQALRLATSPLGSLLPALQRENANAIAMANLTGQVPNLASTSSLLAGKQLPQGQPAPMQQPGVPTLPPESTPGGQGAPLPPPPMNIPGGQGGSQMPPSPGGNPPSQGELPNIPGMKVPEWNPPAYNQQLTAAANEAAVKQYERFYQNQPEVKAYNEFMQTQAKQNAEKLGKYGEAKSSLDQLRTNANQLYGFIDTAQNIIKENPNLSTGWGYAATSWAPNSAGGALANTLETIKARLGLSELEKLRAQGATLGQVTEAEHRLLQALNGSLDPKQSSQLVENLKNIKEFYPVVVAQKEAAFNRDYGKFNLGTEQQPTGQPTSPATNQTAQPSGQPANVSPLSSAEKAASIFNAKKAVARGQNPNIIREMLLNSGIDPQEAGL